MSKIHDFLLENVYTPVDAWTAGALANGMQQTTGSFLKSEYQLSELKKVDFFGEGFRRSTAFAPIEAVVAVAVAVLASSPLTLIASCDNESGKGNADEADTISGAPQGDTADSPQEIEKEKLKSPCDTDGNGLIDDDQIPDPALRESIKTYLGLGPVEVITLLQAEEMTGQIPAENVSALLCDFLYDSSHDIFNLGGIQCFPNIACIHLGKNEINDLSPLQGLANLSDLDLSSNQISDLSPLQGSVNLSYLNLGGNQISDLGPLQGLVNLNSLSVHANQISDLGPLEGLVNLSSLLLFDNQISDLGPLQALVSLSNLWIDGNQINDLSPLQGLVNLNVLVLNGNQISDLSPLQGLVNLERLSLVGNQIGDLTPLQGLTKLNWLQLDDNQISDISALLLNPGLGAGDRIELIGNPNIPQAQIDQLCAKGVEVVWDLDNDGCNPE